jgi:GT2 family glycosyltransferase
MFRRVLRLYHRYRQRHFQIEWSARRLPAFFTCANIKEGRVQVLARNPNAQFLRLCAEGTTQSAEANEAGQIMLTAAWLRRVEGWRFAWGAEPFRPFPGPGFGPRAWAELAVFVAFLRDGARALPPALRWYRFHNIADRMAVRAALRLEPLIVAAPVNLHTQDGGPRGVPAACPNETPVCIIVPVYNGADLLVEMLDRLARYTVGPAHIVLIEDASSDPTVRPLLRTWVADHSNLSVELIEAPQNRGFVASANLGLARATERGEIAILLNADAFVPQGWDRRLILPICADSTVASVTPFSNEAELCSIPCPSRGAVLLPGQVDALDQVAQDWGGAGPWPDMPTGVGFCMALAPHFLAHVPQFDPAFGRGYGEEVDWCRKTLALGGRHVVALGLFVEHRGGASFGSVEKAMRLAQSAQILRARYPWFDTEVQAWLAQDPIITQRLRLALSWADQLSEEPVPVYVAHSLGGGAEHWLEARLAEDRAAGGRAIALRWGPGAGYLLELHTGAGILRASVQARSDLAALLALCQSYRLIYSCAVGAAEPLDVPRSLLALKRFQDQIEVLFHDYFPLSPSYTLLAADGRFHGVPAENDSDPAHQARGSDGARVPLAAWRAAWGALLDAAAQITVFSPASRDLVAAAYPDIAPRLELRPHSLLNPFPQVIVPKDLGQERPGTLGILGNLSPAKGAHVVAALARALGPTQRIVLLGQVDPAVRLPRRVKVHGAYAPADLPDLVRYYDIQSWLIPSIWPETFCYTVHEALALGGTVYCFDLGGQGDAVRTHSRGVAVPFTPGQSAQELARAFIRCLRGAHR